MTEGSGSGSGFLPGSSLGKCMDPDLVCPERLSEYSVKVGGLSTYACVIITYE